MKKKLDIKERLSTLFNFNISGGNVNEDLEEMENQKFLSYDEFYRKSNNLPPPVKPEKDNEKSDKKRKNKLLNLPISQSIFREKENILSDMPSQEDISRTDMNELVNQVFKEDDFTMSDSEDEDDGVRYASPTHLKNSSNFQNVKTEGIKIGKEDDKGGEKVVEELNISDGNVKDRKNDKKIDKNEK